jgi:hypothetical protein
MAVGLHQSLETAASRSVPASQRYSAMQKSFSEMLRMWPIGVFLLTATVRARLPSMIRAADQERDGYHRAQGDTLPGPARRPQSEARRRPRRPRTRATHGTSIAIGGTVHRSSASSPLVPQDPGRSFPLGSTDRPGPSLRTATRVRSLSWMGQSRPTRSASRELSASRSFLIAAWLGPGVRNIPSALPSGTVPKV